MNNLIKFVFKNKIYYLQSYTNSIVIYDAYINLIAMHPINKSNIEDPLIQLALEINNCLVR